ncbi:hypothetical protein PSTT_02803 [Puccinia striiformis]|uniref:Uncharacterized protein n=1 Tax=Puccinia striiformis TaxID=27350 RepID=A0A2S4VYM3_9BASI|nr:hypothetical protein PSTT_02803 [Puccinia striiformis]
MCIPEQELWLMSILVNLNSRIPPAPSPHVDRTAAPTSTKSYTFPPNLRIFCRTQIREVLLRPVIEAYTRRMAERNHVENWPIPMAKGKKNNFANLLRLGLGGANPPIPPPKLSDIIVESLYSDRQTGTTGLHQDDDQSQSTPPHCKPCLSPSLFKKSIYLISLSSAVSMGPPWAPENCVA